MPENRRALPTIYSRRETEPQMSCYSAKLSLTHKGYSFKPGSLENIDYMNPSGGNYQRTNCSQLREHGQTLIKGLVVRINSALKQTNQNKGRDKKNTGGNEGDRMLHALSMQGDQDYPKMRKERENLQVE